MVNRKGKRDGRRHPHKKIGPPIPVRALASPAMSGWVNPTASNKELVVRATDYFDSAPKFYTQYLFSVNENGIFQSPGLGSSANYCRVLSAKFYALPRFSNDAISSATVLVAFAVPATLPLNSASTVEEQNSTSLCQKSTLLTPTSVSDWVLVGEMKSTAFDRSQAVPAYAANPGSNAGLQVLGTLALLNPDDGTLSTSKVQYRVDIEYAQTVPNIATIKGAVPVTDNVAVWREPIDGTDPSDLAAFVQPLKIRDFV